MFPPRRQPIRRFEDVQRLLSDGIERRRVDPDEARWYLLGREVVARHRNEAWRAQGAPRRRASDRVELT